MAALDGLSRPSGWSLIEMDVFELNKFSVRIPEPVLFVV